MDIAYEHVVEEKTKYSLRVRKLGFVGDPVYFDTVAPDIRLGLLRAAIESLSDEERLELASAFLDVTRSENFARECLKDKEDEHAARMKAEGEADELWGRIGREEAAHSETLRRAEAAEAKLKRMTTERDELSAALNNAWSNIENWRSANEAADAKLERVRAWAERWNLLPGKDRVTMRMTNELGAILDDAQPAGRCDCGCCDGCRGAR